jgi:hypothetical protein
MPDSWETILSSTVMFVLTFIITTILHELAHALTGLMLGSQPILHDTFVEHRRLTDAGEALTAAAGPLFSLTQGIVLFSLFNEIQSAPRLTQLFVLWLALHGLVNFFGYLINAPFAPHGDIGQVATYLRFSRPAQLGLLAIGVTANWAIGILATRPLLQLAPVTALIATPDARTDYIAHAAILPWLFGAAGIVMIRYPPRFWITLIYPAVSGLFTVVSWTKAATMPDVEIVVAASSRSPLWPWVVFLAMTLVLFRFVLAPGLQLGRARPSDL